MNEWRNVGFGLESTNLCMETKLPLRVNFKVHKLYLNKAVFFFLFKKHFLLIIQSNNSSRKMSTDLVTYLTNAKHVLFSLKTNQGHINCIRDPWKQYQNCGLCDLILSDALLTELWDLGNVTFSVRSTLCWETESEGWSQLYGLQACTTVAPRKKLGKHLS